MPKIKICGITNINDAKCAEENGADALGYIFYKKSKRYIEPDKVMEITRNIPPFISNVGVFVNEEINELLSAAEAAGIDTVQLHGEEDLSYIREIEKKYKVIKAFGVDSDIISKIKNSGVKWFLLDAFDPIEKGGTGKRFNWELVKEAGEYGRIILAGGINSDNVEEALKLNTYALDISSGVEISHGIKDHQKIVELMNKIKTFKNSIGG